MAPEEKTVEFATIYAAPHIIGASIIFGILKISQQAVNPAAIYLGSALLVSGVYLGRRYNYGQRPARESYAAALTLFLGVFSILAGLFTDWIIDRK